MRLIIDLSVLEATNQVSMDQFTSENNQITGEANGKRR